jgi:hypothetical protein
MEKMFLNERWQVLLTESRLRILMCYEGLDDKLKQLRYLLLLSASSLPDEQRSAFLDKAVQLSDSNELVNTSFTIRTDELFEMKSVQFLNPKEDDLSANFTFHLKANLCNKLVRSLSVKRVLVILDANGSKPNRASNVSLSFSKLHLNEKCEQSPNVLTYNSATVGIKCVNVQRILKRTDSHQTFSFDREAKVETYEYAFASEPIDLAVGNNTLNLFLTCDESHNFRLKHLVIEWKHNLTFLGDLHQHQIAFDVHLQKPKLELNSVTCTNLVAGIEQPVELVFRNGSKALAKSIKCKITASPEVVFVPSSSSVDSSPTTYHYHTHHDNLAPFEEFVITFSVLAQFKDLQKFSILNFDFNCEYESSQRDKESISLTTNFLPPFVTVFTMHTCVNQKFIEMQITGSCEHIFELSNARIKFPSSDPIPIEPLFSVDETFTVFNGQIAHYVWRLMDNKSSVDGASDQLDCLFWVDYRLHPHPTDAATRLTKHITDVGNRTYAYSCSMSRTHFRTLFEIEASVSPCSRSEFCRVGQLCALIVTVKRTEYVSPQTDGESLMYELVCDRVLWNVNGRTAGVLSPAELSDVRLRFEVIPLSSGFLPIPVIRLSRYVSSTSSTALETVESSDESLKTNVVSASLSDAQIISFESGQVYNHSRSRQVNVLPSSSLLPVEPSA